jgi:hypothetical protein
VLFPKRVWGGLTDGSVSLAFRYWRRPTVKAAGTLHCPVGVLAIDAVDRITLRDVTAAHAHAAGYDSRAALLADLAKYRRPGTTLHRVGFHYLGEDPRRALREDDRLSPAELLALRERLARMDRASRHGPWTFDVLTLIRENPATLAAELAASRGRETLKFKADVRKLKTLGLTESLRVGYRLSPRGRAVLDGAAASAASSRGGSRPAGRSGRS